MQSFRAITALLALGLALAPTVHAAATANAGADTRIVSEATGGMAGVHMNLFINGSNGRWKPQFGF